jgi:hypothetical protein
MMGWLHTTRVWYLICIVYFIACCKIPTKFPLTSSELVLRLLASLASSANVLISDGYHNGDKRGAAAYTAEAETTWLRWDYVGISSVLTTLLWLWSANIGMCGRLPAVGVASGVCTALVGALSAAVVPRKAGHTAVKLILATQFVGLLGYLVKLAAAGPCNVSLRPPLPSSSSACDLCGPLLLTACAPLCVLGAAHSRVSQANGVIFAVYAPGLLLYVLKWPKSNIFGFHEWFHTSVLAGHVVSMVSDLRDIVAPCARVAAAACRL